MAAQREGELIPETSVSTVPVPVGTKVSTGTGEILETEPAPQPKAWWKSKVLWLNVIGTIIFFLTPFMDQTIATDASVQKIIVSVVTVLNILLRLLQNGQQALTVGGKTVKEYLRKS